MRPFRLFPWRHLLVWCLALLLPLQGLAAGVGLHCAGMAWAAAASTATPPCHAEEAAHEALSTDIHAAAASPEEAPADGAHVCSACAVCCIGAALPSHSRWAPIAKAAPTQPAAALAHRAGITMPGLDRPPKPAIA